MKLEWTNLEEQIGSWVKYLTPIFESREIFDLYQEFKAIGRKGITPAPEDLYKFLRACQPEDMKVIFILLDSYPGKYKTGTLQANGIPMDCSNSPDGRLQPSLTAFYDGIANEYNEEPCYNVSLDYLCKQGVLLGNRALNCKLNKTTSFLGKWDFFWKYFFEEVITPYFPGIPIVLLGKEAQKLKKYIFEMSNPVFELSHPSAAAKSYTTWETDGVFHKINKIIELNNGPEFKIIWNHKTYEEVLDLPF